MKIFYDSRTDTLSVILKDNVTVYESDEEKPGVILDYDKDGNLISLEILDASQRVTDTRKVDFQLAEWWFPSPAKGTNFSAMTAFLG
jgi:uncharacterized protein YuzE